MQRYAQEILDDTGQLGLDLFTKSVFQNLLLVAGFSVVKPMTTGDRPAWILEHLVRLLTP